MPSHPPSSAGSGCADHIVTICLTSVDYSNITRTIPAGFPQPRSPHGRAGQGGQAAHGNGCPKHPVDLPSLPGHRILAGAGIPAALWLSFPSPGSSLTVGGPDPPADLFGDVPAAGVDQMLSALGHARAGAAP
jgi:hypothetical protein